MGLDCTPSPWHGAPGPRERKPAGQAQWKEPTVLSQRPGPQGGGSWAHSSTSSSHAEPRKPAGQTQRKEPDRFSQTPLPQRPGLCVHSSTSARGKGPRVTPLCPPHPCTPLGLPDLHHFHFPLSILLPPCLPHSNPLFPIIQILHPPSSIPLPFQSLSFQSASKNSSPHQLASFCTVLNNSTPFPHN